MEDASSNYRRCLWRHLANEIMDYATGRSVRMVSPASPYSHYATNYHDDNDFQQRPMAKLCKLGDVISSRVRRSNASNCTPKTGKRMFGCPLCRYATDRKNNLKRHLSTMHRECMAMDHVSFPTMQQIDCCQLTFRKAAEKQVSSRHGDDEVSKWVNYRRLEGNDNLLNQNDVKNRRHLVADRYSVLSDKQGQRAGCDDLIQKTAGFESSLEKVIGYVGKFPVDDSSSLTSSIYVASPGSTEFNAIEGDDGTRNYVTANESRIASPDSSSDNDCSGLESQVRFFPRPILAYRKASSRMFFYNRLESTHAVLNDS